MSAAVVVLDYGVGNLLSVQRAFEHCDASVTFAHTESDVKNAGHLVLPGVGAFGKGMEGLRARGFDAAIHDHVAAGRPLLAICLGMQMLLSRSEEFGDHTGLGVIDGSVRAIDKTTVDGAAQKIPNIGWVSIHPATATTEWARTPLEATAPSSAVYVLHSFCAEPTDPAHRLADYEFGGRQVSAAISDGLVFGTQFHPEKSGPVGLKMIRTFTSL